MYPACVVVVDLGGTHLRMGHLCGGRPARSSSVAHSDLLRPDPVGAMASLLGSYIGARRLRPDAVVIGMPVSLGEDLDTVLSSPNLPSLEGMAFASALTQALGRPVLLERDVILHLLGEGRAGAARGVEDVLAVYFGTGVGAAYLQGGRPHRGHPVSLELGHIPVRTEGRLCVCGNVDCLEAYACGHTLQMLAAGAGLPVAELFVHRTEHPALDHALQEFVRDQAYALATAANLLGPELLLIGGGIPEMSGYPRPDLLVQVRHHLRHPQPRASLAVRWADLGWRAALHGAGQVVAERG